MNTEGALQQIWNDLQEDRMKKAEEVLQQVWNVLQQVKPADNGRVALAQQVQNSKRALLAREILRPLFELSELELLRKRNAELEAQLAEKASQESQSQDCPSCRQGVDCSLKAGHAPPCRY